MRKIFIFFESLLGESRISLVTMEHKRRAELIPFPKGIVPPKGRASQAHRRLFDLLDAILPASSLTPTGMTECELRFFSLRPHIEEVVALSEAPSHSIQQHYFDERYLPIVSWFVLRALHKIALWSTLPLKRARIRRTVEHGVEGFCIDIKGPKSQVGRLDVSVAIDKVAFYALVPFCEGGVSSKLRYVLSTPVDNGIKGRLETHVDLLLAAGNSDECIEPGVVEAHAKSTPFALIEMELHSLELAPYILEGMSTIPILRHAVPLWREKKLIRQPFSAVRLARQGFSPELKRAVRMLTKRCELQRTLSGRH